ncbi:hypothetical protein [Henriciella sp.]|uniref:hypothetical protein n=1 Tax=Henriciella sp. TaxID=1968823 RepID=UPI0026029D94|nr:hypothetical protein [Henriciella sp.]
MTRTAEPVRFEEIGASDFLDMAMPLLAEHREELATDKALMVLKPDRERYEALDDLGMLLVIGAFRGEELVGYSANIISPNLHYSDLTMCQNDVLFVRKADRKGPLGLKLIRETEKRGKARGAQIMLWHAKPGTSLDKLMPRMGASVQDVIWKRNL